MRAALCALALLVASTTAASTAVAQVSGYAVQPGAVMQIQPTNILDGVWRVNGLGHLTITTRPDEVLEGQLDGRACHGQHRGNTFALFCPNVARGPYLITGQATLAPPVVTRGRSRVAAQPARIAGQIHMSHLDRRGHVEEIATLSGTRQ